MQSRVEVDHACPRRLERADEVGEGRLLEHERDRPGLDDLACDRLVGVRGVHGDRRAGRGLPELRTSSLPESKGIR